MAITGPDQRIAECGKQLAIEAARQYTSGTSLHPATLIAACARIAGAQSLRSSTTLTSDMQPGMALLAPQLDAGTRLLLRTCASVLESLGHHLPAQPSASLSDDFKHVREDFSQSYKHLAPAAERLKLEHGLDAAQMARAAAVATAITIHSVRTKVPPERGFGVASVAFTEGAKTVPPALDGGNAA